MAITYFIRSIKKADSEVSVWIKFRNKSIDYRVPSGQKVPARFWDKKSGSVKTNVLESQETVSRLRSLDSTLDELKSYLFEKAWMQGESLTKEDLSNYVQQFIESKRLTALDFPRDIMGYLHNLIQRMKEGSFKFKGASYDEDTIKVWSVFEGVLSKFMRHHKTKTGIVVRWDNIDKSVADSFMQFLDESGYMTKTTNKYLTTMKALIKYAYTDGLHDNKRCLEFFFKQREVEGCSATKIYLTKDELQALYEMPLSGTKDKVRDIFLIGCYTCQRISDYGRLCKENFCTTPRGTKVVKLIQEKTNNSITIPIINDNLLAIGEKYGFVFPSICDQIMNRYIKEIAKELSVSVPSLAGKYPTTLTMKEKDAEKKGKIVYERDSMGRALKAKYDLISSHTARRSGITNLYLSRLFSTRQMMSVSGHTTEDNFFAYVRLSSDELADQIDTIIQGRKRQSINEDLF